MAAPQVIVTLTADQHRELVGLREHHPKAYVRERAAGILKVAGGLPIWRVARSGLLRRRRPETVADWIVRYQSEGAGGLLVRAGRGRKPAFSPPVPRRRRRAGGVG